MYMLIQESAGFKTEIIIRAKGDLYHLLRESIQLKETAGTNVYAPNNKALKFIRQKSTETKGETQTLDHTSLT